MGAEPNPPDPDWAADLAHIISEGDGLYWQGNSAKGDCYLQFDLGTKRQVNCFRIIFFEQHLRRYRFKITYNTTTNNPNGAYYVARDTEWSALITGNPYVSYYLDSQIEARYFRIYFYGNDGNNLNTNYVRVDEIRIWNIGFRMITPNTMCEWNIDSSYTILYTQFPDSGDPRDHPKRIELHKNNSRLCIIADDVINSGRYTWLVGSDTDTSTSADTILHSGSDYTVKVVDKKGYGSLESDYFTIVGNLTPAPTSVPTATPVPTSVPTIAPSPTPSKSITVIHPGPGDEIVSGNPIPVGWTSFNITGPVEITLYNPLLPVTTCANIESTPNDGYHTLEYGGILRPGAAYFIKITSVDNPRYYGEGPAFSITGPSPIPHTGLGDVDRDGYISLYDVFMVIDYSVNIVVPGFYPEYGDVNLDRYINAVDAMLIYNYLTGEIPALPLTPTPEPTKLSMDVELPISDSWGGINHWIPNTGEDFGPLRFKATAENTDGGNFIFTGDFTYIDILSPLDDNFDPGDTGNDNIRNNKGTCRYYVYAKYNIQPIQLLKIFELDSAIINSAERYKTIYSATGHFLKVRNDGYLYYDKDGMIYDYFFINIRTGAGTIRPGDDLRLRFGVVYYPEFNVTVSEGDFMAVYDKKLVWRAQQYIDETKNPATGAVIPGVIDWNNEHRWRWADAERNEWDKDWEDVDNDKIIDEAGPYHGQQCIIKPWTRPYDPDSEFHNYAIRKEYGSVAYTELGRDTPYDFNDDLTDQT
ncbi:MAG: hypothetical protein JXJ04_16765, partial [Spirochaetales bacterium]|nr:hypothetical protein [Spirochaetales bacterium]